MTGPPGGVEDVADERLLTAVRGLGIAFAVPALLTTQFWPSDLIRGSAWVLLGVLLLGTVVIWVLNTQASHDARARLSFWALVFDIVVVSGFVLVFSYEVPNVTWALLVTLPFDGALRFGWRGAALVGVVSEAVFIVHGLLREVMGGIPLTASAHFFVLLLLAIVSGVTGVLVEVWRRQGVRYRAQAHELDRAHRIRDRLMAVTSHEIRGSLAAIGSTASLLQQQRHRLPPDRVDRMLAATGRQVEHLLVLVDDLLVTGRGDERGLELNPVWGDLESTVTLALSAAERSRRGHHVDISGVEPVWCELDHQRVQQVVRNLVENAFKYSPAGGSVTVGAHRVTTGVVLTVADRGGGIPADQQEELFEPFRRGHNADSTQGVGLGLYVVSRIVSACAGTVGVDSEPGATRFTVTLPCRAEPVGTDFAAVHRRTRE
ncbi:MAG: HAMP domain-containing histidine kinase [Actinomycetota bacterium]|nr:HAMP domain-containing histidine kinase [Actinomycetota bacterium]